MFNTFKHNSNHISDETKKIAVSVNQTHTNLFTCSVPATNGTSMVATKYTGTKPRAAVGNRAAAQPTMAMRPSAAPVHMRRSSAMANDVTMRFAPRTRSRAQMPAQTSMHSLSMRQPEMNTGRRSAQLSMLMSSNGLMQNLGGMTSKMSALAAQNCGKM